MARQAYVKTGNSNTTHKLSNLGHQVLADAPPISSTKYIPSMRHKPTEAGKERGGPWLAGARKMAAAAAAGANGSGGSSGMEVDAAGNGVRGATSGVALAECLEYFLSLGEATSLPG